MAQIQATGITGSLNIIGSVTASSGFFGISQGGSSGPAVSYITTSNPPGDVNPAASGVLWQNNATSELFTCIDNTAGRNEWAGTSGSRLYYARTASSSLSSSYTTVGVVSGSAFTASITLVDRYGTALVKTQSPTQSFSFTMSNATSTTSLGTLTNPSTYISSQIITSNYSGSVTITASIDGTPIPNYLTIPVNFPRQLYGVGITSAPEFGGVTVGWATSGGLGLIDTNRYWASASAGNSFGIYLTADGRLFSRGTNTYGSLGDGSQTNRTSIVAISSGAGPWKKISAGYQHACAINWNNELYCWGLNGNYQLGLGDTTLRTSPTKVGTTADWTDVSCGCYHTLAVKTNGTLWAWGVNNIYQLGLGDQTQRTTPTQVGSDTNWSRAFAGYQASFAIKTTGTLWAWGYNNVYQLGLGDTTTRTTPTQVGSATDWQRIFVMNDNGTSMTNVAFGIRGTSLYGWGYNNTYQLTTGSAQSYVTTPTATLSTVPVKKVAAYQYGVYIIDTGSGLWGWRTTEASNYVGSTLAYGSTTLSSLDTNASYNLGNPGVPVRMSSIYTFDDVTAHYYSLTAVARIITGSNGPSGNPSSVSVSANNPTTSQMYVTWVNGDSTAETRLQIVQGSNIETNWIRPGKTSTYLAPSILGASMTVRLTHVKNGVIGSGGVTSSAFSLCTAYGTELSNTCNGSGQRTITYADGNCGTYQNGPYCDTSCGGYSYYGEVCSNQDNCGCNIIYVCYNRYTYSGGGPCATTDYLIGDYCAQFYGCCCGCGGC